MIKKLLLTLISCYFFSCFSASSQNQRQSIVGRIMNDSLSVDKVHVVNKNTNKGTYSNSYGDFAIPVKIDDTLVFSAVQFKPYRRIISEIDLQQLQLVISLQSKINELDEVIVKSISYAKGLGLPNADKKPLIQEENRLNAHNKSSAPVVALATLLNQRGGIDNLYYLLSGQRKRDRKLKKIKQQAELEKNKTETLQLIRIHFGDEFFINSLKLPEEEIDNFMRFVLTDEVATLFIDKRYLELTELLFRSSVQFVKESKP